MYPLEEKVRKIRCLISDVDGVLTNGRLYLDNFGNELKGFHVQDGMGLVLLSHADIEVAVITTSRSKLIEHRMQQLGIRHYFTGQVNKQEAYQEIKNRLTLPDEAIAYIGDDLPDIPIMQQVGFSVAVGNAVAQVKAIADWETQLTGGCGAVRELCDFILKTQDKLDIALTRYLG